MAPLVAAAGNILGGLAAQALGAGKKAGESISGSGPNITQAEANVNGQKFTIPQVDASAALAQFAQAAREQDNYYRQGLAYYEKQVALGKMEMAEGFKKANAALKPLSSAAVSATKEMQRFIGLDPLSETSTLLDSSQSLTLSPEIHKLLTQAEGIKDPVKRTEMLSQINQRMAIGEEETYAKTKADLLRNREIAAKQFAATKEQISQQMRENYNVSGYYGLAVPAGMKGVPLTIDEVLATKDQYGTAAFWQVGPSLAGPRDHYTNPYSKPLASYYTAEADYKSKLSSIDALDKWYEERYLAQKDLVGQYTALYEKGYDSGYTGAQVIEKLQQTPGYQFQFDQGTKAIERQGAAAGMLGSGNTLTALTQYGQDLAQNFYQVHLSNLGNVAAIGSGALSQTAANLAGEGVNRSNMSVEQGVQGNNTYVGIGNAYAESLYKQGETQVQVAMFNANMQAQTLSQARSLQAAQATQGMASLPGIMNAQNSQSQFAYSVAQNQQGGRAYYQPQASGAGSMSWMNPSQAAASAQNYGRFGINV